MEKADRVDQIERAAWKLQGITDQEDERTMNSAEATGISMLLDGLAEDILSNTGKL